MSTLEANAQAQGFDIVYEPGSYRDRSSRVFYRQGEVYRGLNAEALDNWRQLCQSNFFARAIAKGTLVGSQEVEAEEPWPVAAAGENGWAAVLRHEPIPFVSYPYEWTFGMLREAALLQLELMAEALDEGMILKDGSVFNLQFRGAQPVFIDVPSLVALRPGAAWEGYRQFCQTMLFPLMLQAYKNVPFQPWLRGNIEGIEPLECRNLLGWRALLRPGVLGHVYLQTLLQSALRTSSANEATELANAGFHTDLIKANVRRLRRVVDKLRWRQNESNWSNYADQNSYTDAAQNEKKEFVRAVAHSGPWKLCWDLGCNTGTYSRIAAEGADYVVAMERDHLAAETLYRSLAAEGNQRILPLLMNAVDSSPGQGWRGTERKPLIDRGRPDLVLCLALVHHIVLGSNVLLSDFLDWLAELGADLVIEFVTRDDPMVKALLCRKADLFEDYDLTLFEKWLGQRFDVVRRQVLSSQTRILYHARVR